MFSHARQILLLSFVFRLFFRFPWELDQSCYTLPETAAEDVKFRQEFINFQKSITYYQFHKLKARLQTEQ